MIAYARREPWTFTERVFFAAFLVWTTAGLVFTVLRLTPASVGAWPLPAWLREFIEGCLLSGDPVLILLAFINTHLHCARQWTGGVARRWAAIVLVAAFLIETFGVKTGLPFGAYQYAAGHFGPMIGLIPAAIPLAWHVVLTNALFLVRAAAPHLSRSVEALAVGLIATIYDVVLEPFATTIKGYWAWTEGTVPPINYVAWFFLGAIIVRLFAPTLSNRFRFDLRPALILAGTVMIFLAGEVASWMYL
ncbi:MAG: carotenoid biosynthesis protein [Verrucomicrobiota bacterium]